MQIMLIGCGKNKTNRTYDSYLKAAKYAENHELEAVYVCGKEYGFYYKREEFINVVRKKMKGGVK